MKSILVPTEHFGGMTSVLDTVLLLARQFNSYVEGFPLRIGIRELVAGDPVGGYPVETYRQESEQEAQQARELFEAFMQQNNVPRSTDATSGLSFGWFADAPEGEDFVGSYGRVFDAIVLARPDADSIGLHNRAIESGLFESGRPVLLSPPSPPKQIGTNVLIPWNCSTEQSRANALAMPFLQRAERVTVLIVTGGSTVPGPSAEQLLPCLLRHGVKAGLMTVGLEGRNTGEAILAVAQSLGCDLVVKGAYTQSRLRQMIFGGATNHILTHANLPVLMAH
jgi:nucleotide-binding universal stress UspA family protein